MSKTTNRIITALFSVFIGGFFLLNLLLPDKANDSEAGVFFTKNGRKMKTEALICYHGMG